MAKFFILRQYMGIFRNTWKESWFLWTSIIMVELLNQLQLICPTLGESESGGIAQRAAYFYIRILVWRISGLNQRLIFSIPFYEKSIKINPNGIFYYTNKALALLRLKQPD